MDFQLVWELFLIGLNLYLGWIAVTEIQKEHVKGMDSLDEGNTMFNRLRIPAHFIIAGMLISMVLIEPDIQQIEMNIEQLKETIKTIQGN